MRWGFGWELGPFETWDAIGVREVLEAVGRPRPIPPLVDEVLRAGRNRFRVDRLATGRSGSADAEIRQDRQQVVRRNPGASLIDLGDGVLAVEFHSKMNAIGGDTLADAAGRRHGSRAPTSRRSSSATTRRISRPART